MHLITKRSLIHSVADRWHAQYAPFDNDSPLFSKRMGLSDELSKKQIHAALASLDKETATEFDVANIIGNRSWTGLKCHECGCDQDAVIVVGEAEDYESHTAHLCQECAEKIRQMDWANKCVSGPETASGSGYAGGNGCG